VETERLLRAEDWLYLYGIVRRSALDLSGVDGIEGARDVVFVGTSELACAVSPVPRAAYNQETLNLRGQQLDWLGPRAMRHQQVIDHLRQTGAVIPLKFGTLCSKVEDVRDILQAHRQPLLHSLEFLQGRDEWGVKVYADADLTGQAIDQAGGAPKETAPVSPGEAYFLRKKRQKLASDRISVRISELEDEIYERLLPCAVDARKGRCVGPPSEPSRLPVLNAALLLDQDKITALEEIVGQLEADYRTYGIVIELSGPWAPYGFCGGLGQAPAGEDSVQVPERCEN
jgi:hypothetical protein